MDFLLCPLAQCFYIVGTWQVYFILKVALKHYGYKENLFVNLSIIKYGNKITYVRESLLRDLVCWSGELGLGFTCSNFKT